MKYDILELNTNVKPRFLQHLFALDGAFEHLIYLDPDIQVFSPLLPVTSLLRDGAAAVLTPHITAPILDQKSPSEQDMLYNGTYNLGFVAFRRSYEADAILDWWNRRCLDLGFSEGRTGLFVDQKWMNLLPGLFPHVAILRDAGCNMAYWNLHERVLVYAVDSQGLVPETTAGQNHEAPLVQGSDGSAVPLRFFHFSGVAPDEPGVISRHTDRFTLESRPDLQAIFAAYTSGVRDHRNPETDRIAYGFDRLSDGTVITRLARRIFAAELADSAASSSHDPFDARGPSARSARRRGLFAGRAAAPKQTWREFDPKDRRVAWVHRGLRLALRALGPNRYELLMRYLAFISVLRYQAPLLAERRAGRVPPASASRLAAGVALSEERAGMDR